MAKKETSKDLFMQFASIAGVLGAADSSVLQAFQLPTGLSVRGGLLWLVHAVQFFHPMHKSLAVGAQGIRLSLSTHVNEATLPGLEDPGVIAVCLPFLQQITAENAYGYSGPGEDQHYLPPVPLAAPVLTLYAESNADEMNLWSAPVGVRIGYTTSPLDEASYAEIAEVWGQ